MTIESQLNSRSTRPTGRYRAIFTGLALYPLAGGLISFLGWVADIPRLSGWDNQGIAIQPNASVAAMCSGAALLMLGWGQHRVAAVLGLLVAFVGSSAL